MLKTLSFMQHINTHIHTNLDPINILDSIEVVRNFALSKVGNTCTILCLCERR